MEEGEEEVEDEEDEGEEEGGQREPIDNILRSQKGAQRGGGGGQE